MTKNPIINALLGLLYIVLVVSVIFYTPPFVDKIGGIFIPVAMLSLFVFSAASMGYLFLYQPLQLFLGDERKKSVALFINTLIAFAVSAAILVSIGLYLAAH